MSKKVCSVCGYEPEQDAEQKPMEPLEDCPQCGGHETVQDEAAALNEDAEEE